MFTRHLKATSDQTVFYKLRGDASGIIHFGLIFFALFVLACVYIANQWKVIHDMDNKMEVKTEAIERRVELLQTRLELLAQKLPPPPDESGDTTGK